MSEIKLKVGQEYSPLCDEKFTRWVGPDDKTTGSETDRYQVRDFFDPNWKYRGPDARGIEPLFDFGRDLNDGRVEPQRDGYGKPASLAREAGRLVNRVVGDGDFGKGAKIGLGVAAGGLTVMTGFWMLVVIVCVVFALLGGVCAI